MAGSMRAELASSSLDGSAFGASYPNGQRASLDRSGSFREGFEGRGLASGPSGSRNGGQQMDISPLTQFLTLEAFSLGEQKYTRYNELRRVLGVSLEEHHLFGSSQSKPLPSMASEDVKRFRSSLQDSSNKARDRRKVLNESIVKLDKYRNILSKKQQRNDVPSSEKLGSLSLLKNGGQVHQNTLDPGSQRLEDRTKNTALNKRARSMVDVRSEGRNSVSMRSGAVTGRDKSSLVDINKSMLRTCNGVSMPSEDKVRELPAGGDGWEKRLKRKRSVGTMVNRIPDGDRDLKQPIQQRPNNEPRPRSCDGIGFRAGISNAITGANKTDPSSQLSGASSRVVPRNDMDNGSLPSDRKERAAGLDKERVIARGHNQSSVREDVQLGNQSPLTKGKASRAPRTSSGLVMNTTSNSSRSSGGVDGWEQASCLNKVQPLSGVTNRKRVLPTGSSSPPVAQWVGQRPQKISRPRRANVVSPVSNFEEAHISSEGYTAPDLGARLTTIESGGLLLPRAIPNNSHQSKLKLENVPSPSGFSESEESGATDNKFKVKGADDGEVEDGALNVVHKAPTFVSNAKKNKVSLKEEIADGVRRQGRSGRGSIQTKSCLPVSKEKIENMDTTKPLKSGRLGSSDMRESKVGRPPSKRTSDRKAYSRPGQIINSCSSEWTGESEDDREELLAAANAARSASYVACSGPFWKKMEPIFAFVSPEDIKYVKHQPSISFAEELDKSLCSAPDADCNRELGHQAVSSTHSSFPIDQHLNQTAMIGLHKDVGSVCVVDEPRPVKTTSGKSETRNWFDKMIPLSQRLLSAFIAEDGTENNWHCMIEPGDGFSQFSSDYYPYGSNSHVEHEHKADFIKSEFELCLDFKHKNNYSSDTIPCNGYTASSNCRSSNIQNLISAYEPMEANGILVHSDTGYLSEFEPANSNSLISMDTSFSAGSPSDCQFEHFSLDDRILTELHSIGLFPETVPDLSEGEDEEIDNAISELKIRLYQQAKKKKPQLFESEKAIQDRKELEERNLEHLAMNKLVEMAYKKLTGGRGSHGSSHKSGASKVAKQLAVAFAKRTLARCQKFEETGQSCFSEFPFCDVVSSAPIYSSDAKCIDGVSSGTAAHIFVDSRSGQLGSWASASGALTSGVTSIGERSGLGHKLDRGLLAPINGLTYMSEQTFGKNDQVSNRGKKKEVLLDDVVTSAASRATTILSHTSPGGAKWKRTEKDRDQNKDIVTRNSVTKAGRASLSNGRGERKTKTKPKQKIAQLSTSGNGLGRVTETSNFVLPSKRESCEIVNSGRTRLNQEAELTCSGSLTQNICKETEDNIFTNLPLHGIDSIDELDVADGLDGQGQDIGSWLNVDEDALDNDLVGLEIPMDDLSELKLNF